MKMATEVTDLRLEHLVNAVNETSDRLGITVPENIHYYAEDFDDFVRTQNMSLINQALMHPDMFMAFISSEQLKEIMAIRGFHSLREENGSLGHDITLVFGEGDDALLNKYQAAMSMAHEIGHAVQEENLKSIGELSCLLIKSIRVLSGWMLSGTIKQD